MARDYTKIYQKLTAGAVRSHEPDDRDRRWENRALSQSTRL